jgi:DNA-binding NarL/FixJ family response regulator
MISVILVEDVDQDRECIISLLKSHADFAIMDFGYDGYDAIALSKKHKPDIAILNLNLNFFNEIEVSHLLKNNSPGTSVVLMSSRVEIHKMKKSVEGKISAYLLKEEDLKNLAAILRQVKAGEMYVNHRIGMWAFNLLAELLHGKRHHGKLTLHEEQYSNLYSKQYSKLYSEQYDELFKLNRKELKILTFIGQGRSDKEISGRIHLTNGTVRNYISNVLRKTGLSNRAQLVRYAIDSGLAGLRSVGAE